MHVYADNAATTAMSQTAIDAMVPYFNKIYANPSSLHGAGQEAKEALENARARIAAILGCEAREIYFTSGGSEADNQAIVSAARIGAKKGKKHIISTAFEHHAVLHTLQKLEKEGFEVTLLDVRNNHNITAQQVKDAIREDTCLVTTMYANNEIGSVLPISEIGAVCKEAGVPFHTDAVQAVGHIAINVKEQNIDMLSLSAHKFHGPKGVGALYCRRSLLLTNIIEGGAQERGKRGGTENVAQLVMPDNEIISLLHPAEGRAFTESDTVLVAVPSYCGRVPGPVVERLQVFGGNGARAILLCAYGNRQYDDTLSELQDTANALGFKVVAAMAIVTEHSICTHHIIMIWDKDITH